MADDLRGILPEERQVEAGGETFTLRPFLFRQMLKVMPHVVALLSFVKTKEDGDGQLQLQVDLYQVLTEGGDHLAPLMALATGKDLAWVDTLGLDEGCELAAAVLHLNADFFVKTRAHRTLASVAGDSSLPGQTLSQS